MRNTKLKDSISKNKIKHKRRRTMKTRSSGGERKRGSVELYEDPIRKSRRRDTRPEMLTKSLGAGPLGAGFGAVPEEAIQNFVNNEISDDAPQIVSLPVPPERHAFLVDIKEDAIWISDWGGSKNLNLYNKKKKENLNWENYSTFMKLVRQKYNKKPIKYYDVDEILFENSLEHHETCNNSGGCSHYIYKWVEKYYPDYVA